MLSAICFNLEQSEILLSGNGLTAFTPFSTMFSMIVLWYALPIFYIALIFQQAGKG